MTCAAILLHKRDQDRGLQQGSRETEASSHSRGSTLRRGAPAGPGGASGAEAVLVLGGQAQDLAPRKKPFWAAPASAQPKPEVFNHYGVCTDAQVRWCGWCWGGIPRRRRTGVAPCGARTRRARPSCAQILTHVGHIGITGFGGHRTGRRADDSCSVGGAGPRCGLVAARDNPPNPL